MVFPISEQYSNYSSKRHGFSAKGMGQTDGKTTPSRKCPHFGSGRPHNKHHACRQLKHPLQPTELEMWANAQRAGRPAEYRWRPLFNAAKFG